MSFLSDLVKRIIDIADKNGGNYPETVTIRDVDVPLLAETLVFIGDRPLEECEKLIREGKALVCASRVIVEP